MSCILQQVIPTLLVCTALLVCVEADYRLEVQFIRWNNPTGMCGDPRCAANEGCCDPLNPDQQGQPDRCRNGCGYHPRFCVRPLGTESNSTSDCLNRVTFTGFPINDDDLTFGPGSAAFIGTPNPAVFTGRRWPGGIQLFMEVYDLDRGLDNETVDRFAVDASVSVGSNITTTNTGVFGLMELTVNFRMMCVESFFVLDCITCFGVNRDPSTNCSRCLAGYGGSNCDVDLDPCGHTTPCENGATCNNTGPDQYECLCAVGFEGDSCERETNECDPNPCMNGGSCTDLLAGYNCSCPGGFSGRDCDQQELEGGNCGTSSTLLAPLGWGVAGGLLLLVVVLVTVIVCLLIRQRRGAPAVLKGHTPPPQEDIELKPNPGYGVSTSHTHPPQEDIKLKPNPVYGVSNGQAPPIDLKPNPGYGISVPEESQTALDRIHKASGTATDVYDYVLD